MLRRFFPIRSGNHTGAFTRTPEDAAAVPCRWNGSTKRIATFVPDRRVRSDRLLSFRRSRPRSRR